MQRIILFDGVCIFCNRTVRIIIKHDKADKFKFAQLQSAIAKVLLLKQGLDQNELSSVILIEGDQVYTKSDAVIRIALQLSGWPTIISYSKCVPKAIRNFFYDLISKYRYRLFGKQDNCIIPDKKVQDKFLS
jgi:predicted DCC family thiol-disulfide oxidoreductase YuxK